MQFSRNMYKSVARFILVGVVFFGLWVLIDKPVGPGKMQDAVVMQFVNIQSRYSGASARVVVQLNEGLMLTLHQGAYPQYQIGDRVRVRCMSRRISRLSHCEIL